MEFLQWLSLRYPEFREAMEFGMLDGNEVRMYEAVQEAYSVGYLEGIADYQASEENGEQ